VEQQTEILSGAVERIIFQSADGDFVVFVLIASTLSTTVRGSLPTIREGQDIEVEGSWTTHPKFGKQFLATRCHQKIPTTLTGLTKYLASGVIRGIGEVYAEKLVQHFGDNILQIIEHEPHRLKEVGGFAEKRIALITESWKTQRATAQIMVFLQDKGVSPAYANKIFKYYGTSALSVLQENPYRLADEVWGIGFTTADAIAKNLGFTKADIRRLTAGISYVFSTASAQGHLYVERTKLWDKAAPILTLDAEEAPLFEQAFTLLLSQGKVVSIPFEGLEYRGLATNYETEQSLVEHLDRLLKTPSPKTFDNAQLYQELRAPKPGELDLHEGQQQGIMTALSNKVAIITGGPGTGKTTLVKKLISFLERERVTIKLAAPTGRAAKRLMESTGHFATTLHRLLEFDPANGRFVHNARNTLKVDFLIVDEVSMVDLFLAHALIQALPSTAHLVLIGDCNQLPSVGPGNILRDLIESDKIPNVMLTEIFRQARSSLIVVNAHRINHGEFPTTTDPEATLKDFVFIKETEPENLQGHIKRAFEECKRRGFPPSSIQLLTPMNRGIAGTQVLNAFLQSYLHPEHRPMLTNFGTKYHQGDRVMQIRNNYDKNVFNGDIGSIFSIDLESQILEVKFGERVVPYDASELDELVLAYATTIHKSQGSEYPVAIIPLFMQHFMLLQRNLLYTAITRAKKLCILIGEPRAIAMTIKKEDAHKRMTFLKSMIQKSL